MRSPDKNGSRQKNTPRLNTRLIALSVMIGVAFRWFSSMLGRSWPVIALGLIAIKSFVYLPRNYALIWITDVFNVTYLCFLLGLYLAAQLLYTLGTHLRRGTEPPEVKA